MRSAGTTNWVERALLHAGTLREVLATGLPDGRSRNRDLNGWVTAVMLGGTGAGLVVFARAPSVLPLLPLLPCAKAGVARANISPITPVVANHRFPLILHLLWKPEKPAPWWGLASLRTFSRNESFLLPRRRP